MKLHLPKMLRNAVLACITAVAGISTTVGTAAFTGGVVAFSIAQQAQADNDLNVPTGGEFYGGSYEFDFILKAGSIADGESKILAYYGNSVTGDYGANAYVLSRSGDAITLTVGRGRLSSADLANATMTYAGAAADKYTFATLLTMGEAYTLKITGGNQSQVVALWGDGAEIEVGTAYNGNMNGGNASTTMTSVMNQAFRDLKYVISGNSTPNGIELEPYANDYLVIFDLENTDAGKYFTTNSVKVVNSAVQIGETGGDGSKGLIITNGNGGNHQIFTGELAGNGLIKRRGPASTQVSFTGDTTGFNGNIDLDVNNGNTFVLTFGTVTANNTTYTAKPGISSAESGIIGNGNISLNSSRVSLVFNYAASDAPVYITNTFTVPTLQEENAQMLGTLELRGGADYILTKDLDVRGKLVIDAPVTVQGNLALNGTLNLASKNYLTPTGEGSFQTRNADGQMVASTDGNGFYTGDFVVIKAGEGVEITKGTNAVFQLEGNADTNFSIKDGNLVYTGAGAGVYYAMNEQAQATNAIAGASGFTNYHVVKDGVLSVAVGDTLNANNARNVITNTTGEGKISIQSGTSVDFDGINTITSAFRGDIIVNEGANLYLGTDNDSGATGEKALRVVNLAGGVTLDGGMLRFQGKTLNVQRLTSTNDASVLRITDMHGNDRMAYFAEVDLQNKLTVEAKHKYTLKFGCLTGAGDLAISSKENVPFTIDSVRDYSGNIAVGNGVQAVINLKRDDTLSNAQISKTADNASINLTGTGVLNLWNDFADVTAEVDASTLNVTLGAGWNGRYGVQGAEVTSATSTAAISKVGISDLTVKKGGTLTLEGDVWMGGTISLASTLVNNSTKLTLAEDILFDLTEMAYTDSAEARVYQLFTQADLSALTMSNLSEDFLTSLGLKEDSTVLFGADGTLSITGFASERIVWAQQDDLGNHGTWQTGQKFNEKQVFEAGKEYGVTFGALANTELATPETVQLVGAVEASSIEIDPGAGQVYKFYVGDGSEGGISAVKDGIDIKSGTVIFGASTLDMAQDTAIRVEGGVLALESGAMSQQEYVDITLLDGSTLRWQAGNTEDYTLNGGLSVAENASVRLDMGANAIELSEAIGGAVEGTVIQLYGTAGQNITAASGVLGSADVYLNGVNLALAADAQYGFSLSNNTLNGYAEKVTIAASAAEDAKKTTLSGDNSAYQGAVEIGSNTTLVLASAKALGENMALKGAGHVAFSSGGASSNVSYTLTTDDVYTGTTTVGKLSTLYWGENTGARNGAIKLDNGSTLVLNCGIANTISDGLNSAALAKGGVTITSLRDEENAIIPVQWNHSGKTYTGLTTISDNTIVVASNPLSSGLGSNVYLSGTGSILRITNAGNFSTGSNPHYISGAGVVELDLNGEYVMGSGQKWLESVVDLNGTGFGTLRLASGTTLNVGTTSFNNRFAKISEFDVVSGACLVYDENLNWTASQTLHLAGSGMAGSTNASRKAALSFIRGSKNIASKVNLKDSATVYTGSGCTNTLSGAITLNDYTLTKSGAGVLLVSGTLTNGNVNVTEGTMKISGAVSEVDTVTVDSTLVFKGNNMTPGIANVVLNEGSVLSYHTDTTNKVLKLNTVTATNTDDSKHVTIQNDAYHQGIIDIATLNGSGELHIRSYADAATPAGAIVVRGGDFNGTVQVRQSNSGDRRRFVLATDHTNVFADAVINFGQVACDDDICAGFVVGGAEGNTVKVAGVSCTPLETVNDYTYTTGSTADQLDNLQKNSADEIAARTALISGGSANLFAANQTSANTVEAYADNKARTIEITGAGTYDFTGLVGSKLNVKMSGSGKQTLSGKLAADTSYEAVAGTLAISGKGQTGVHTFKASAGGILDMAGYAADTNATLNDTIIANGGTIKDLTLGANMVLTQPALPQGTTTQNSLVTSQLAGNLTLAGGEMKFYLGADRNGAVNTQYAFGANSGDNKLIITAETALTFTPEASRGYIDSKDGDTYDYVLVSGIKEVEGSLSNLRHNFSEDGRAQHSFDVVDGNLVLHVVGKAATLAWTGETTNAANKKLWDVKTTDNWDGDNVFYSDDVVTFGAVTGAQTVTVTDEGVRIGSMQVTGGNYTFEGGTITSVPGLGDIGISGGTVVFNNNIATESGVSITGGNVTFNAANDWIGDTSISGGSTVVKVTDDKGLSDTVVSISNGAELQLAIAGADNTMANSEIKLLSGNIYATENATVSKLSISNTAELSLNVATGKTLTATVYAPYETKNTTLNINYKSEASGKAELNIGASDTTDTQNLGNVTVHRGALTANLNAQTKMGTLQINNSGAKVILNGASGKTLDVATKVTHQSLQKMEVTGGMTLKTGVLEGQGTVLFNGSVFEFSGASVDTKLETAGNVVLKSTYANGSTNIKNNKTLTLTDTAGAATTLEGKWTLNPLYVNWVENGSGALKVGSNANTPATLTLTNSGSLKSVMVNRGSTLTASSDSVAKLQIEKLVSNGSIDNIEVTLTGQSSHYLNASWVSEGAVSGDLIVDVTAGQIGDNTAVCFAASTSDSLTIKRGRVRLHQNSGITVKNGIVLDGAEAILQNDGSNNIATLSDDVYDVTLKQGSLEGFNSWNGTVKLNDEDAIRTYTMGGITSDAKVNIGRLNVDADARTYTKMTDVGSLTLVGTNNTITLIDAMARTNSSSVLGTNGDVTLADDAQLHIDINLVLPGLLEATAPVAYNLGGNLTSLNVNDNVVFDTALSLFNLKAEFSNTGLLTLTKLDPDKEADYYISSALQTDSAWNNKDKDIYHSAEGYSAIVINKATEIDLTGDGVAPAAAQNGLGMVLANLAGNKNLTITGDGDDMVTISNTSGNVAYTGGITATGTDVQILHTDATAEGGPAVDTESVYTMHGKLSITDGELLVTAGKLVVNDSRSEILGGATIADNAGQLILNGDTTLGGTIKRASASEMLPDRADLTSGAATLSGAVAPHIVLGTGQITTLADQAVLDAGVVIEGSSASSITVADQASATISQGATVTGVGLNLKEGTTLNIDRTVTGGTLHFQGASIYGTLVGADTDDGSAAIKVTQADGGVSTYAGNLRGYYGQLQMAGAGTHVLKVNADNTDVKAVGSNVVLVPDGDALYLRSLEVDSGSTVTLNVANVDINNGNKQVITEGGVKLDGTLNLTANLTSGEEGVVFKGGLFDVQDNAQINLTIAAVSDSLANALMDGGETRVVLAEKAQGNTGVTITNGDKLLDKYIHNAQVIFENGSLVLTGDVVNVATSDFHKKVAESENGEAGASLLDNAYTQHMTSINNAQGDVKKALSYLEELVVSGNNAKADETMAAVAGASTAVLGMASLGDIDRQLRTIRNRTTTMGVDQSVVNAEMPYYNAWINAEGDLQELSASGTESGYKLNSWGGTVGFDVDLSPTMTAGLALTAMYGDLSVSGADSASGDMNSYYVSAFARYCASAWTHTFVATVGKSDISLNRTVALGNTSYKTEGETSAMNFGLMYEVGRVYALNEDATSCLQPILNVSLRHTTVDAYAEKNSDAGLEVGEQTMDSLTVSLGARMQAVVGESMYNRTSIFECRAMVKADMGDCQGSSEVSLLGSTAEVKSADMGSVGIEAGAGITIPLGDAGESIFADASIEVRSGYTNANGTVGYRVNF